MYLLLDVDLINSLMTTSIFCFVEIALLGAAAKVTMRLKCPEIRQTRYIILGRRSYGLSTDQYGKSSDVTASRMDNAWLIQFKVLLLYTRFNAVFSR